MSKKLGILGVVALGLVLGSTGAFAQAHHDAILKVNLPGVAEGEIYDRTTLIPARPGPVDLPGPPEEGVTPPTLSKHGGLNIFGSVMSAEPGLGMVAPRGGAMSSPKQMADRQIKRLIRRLD